MKSQTQINIFNFNLSNIKSIQSFNQFCAQIFTVFLHTGYLVCCFLPFAFSVFIPCLSAHLAQASGLRLFFDIFQINFFKLSLSQISFCYLFSRYFQGNFQSNFLKILVIFCSIFLYIFRSIFRHFSFVIIFNFQFEQSYHHFNRSSKLCQSISVQNRQAIESPSRS